MSRDYEPMRVYRAGMAIAIGRAVIGLIGIALVFSVAMPAFQGINEEANEQITNETALKGQDMLFTTFENFLVIVVAITILGVIIASVYQSQVR